MKKLTYRTIFLLAFISCNSNKKEKINSSLPVVDSIQINLDNSLKKEQTSVNKDTVILSKIDSVALAELKRYAEEPKNSIFAYYALEELDEYSIWSDKMFGRCCTEADLLYSELLKFKITANINNTKYPYSNLSDRKYRKAYVFKENENIEISIKLDSDDDWHLSQTDLLVDKVLKTNDTLLKPFKLSLVNGYTKSEKTFKQNGRVKEMKVLLNNQYKGTIKLQDTPLIQEFEIDFVFSKNDVVTLIPINYYKGSTYNDVCISEIQSSLAQTTHPSINLKYKVQELKKIGHALQNKK